MIFKLQIDKDCEESVTAVVHERTSLVDSIEKLVLQNNTADQIPAYMDDEIIMMNFNRVECFFVDGDKTFAIYDDGRRYLIKRRLYELEALLPPEFEKINKSAIANWKKIAKFKVQLSGAVDAVFSSGYSECISRRCFAQLKRRYGL